MAKRKSTGKRQRFSIFKRDKFTCQYCGRTPPTVVLVIDHILPVAKGGETVDHNLITSCETCNQGKGAGILSDVPQSVDTQLALQVERREQLEEYNTFLMKARKRDDEIIRDIGLYWHNQVGHPKDGFVFGPTRTPSIRTFLKRLPAAEIYEAIDIAIGNVQPSVSYDGKAWKYFCGVCWRKIREREPPEESGG